MAVGQIRGPLRIQIMPRRTIGTEPVQGNETLAKQLSAELKSEKDSGQPLIYESELKPNRLRVVVVWDAWEPLQVDERVAVILRAYELAEGVEARNRIFLATGTTVPEATAAGMLPYQVSTALRKSDPVSFDDCWNAMLEEGASKLFGESILQLRFATQAEADAAVKRLVKRLPKSKGIWLINRDISVQDRITVEDEARVEIKRA